MRLNKRLAVVVVGVGLVVGTIGSGVVLAQSPTPTAPAAPVQERAGRDEQVQDPAYRGSIVVNEAQYEGKSETDEAAALQALAKISADQAKAAALAANPGATAKKVSLESENGVLVYAVELANGVEVKVDAGNAKVLHTEQAGEGQEERAGQPEAAAEVTGAESAAAE
jgi:uncharacterized membrane protein YkoI